MFSIRFERGKSLLHDFGALSVRAPIMRWPYTVT